MARRGKLTIKRRGACASQLDVCASEIQYCSEKSDLGILHESYHSAYP